ncbi:entry exclusion lipoprotein TrbK [Janthinobacterium lividum]|uniref:entry exclusion lipoprotein TrbK n=1 Tax=Janthinobacterium lividum TaxID=29581 RepID=UPI000E0E6E93|nr:entry exclusion lipoprotein TrbK [Janthinobacterium lividum]
MIVMKKMEWKVTAVVMLTCLAACNSYKEPATDDEWRVFCEAPDSVTRIKAIGDEGKRQQAGSICARAPWQKFEPSAQRSY